MSETPTPASPEQPSASPTMQRAEDLFDRFGAQVGQAALVASTQLRRAIERAREEAEDMWAEAEQIRRGQRD